MFYLYAILDLRKPGRFSTPYVSFLYQPFYIGKGFNKRMFSHIWEAESKIGKTGKRSYKTNLILKMLKEYGEYPAIKFHYEEDESLCYLKEFDLVEHFGLTTEGGVLCNVKPGGKGNLKGYVYCKDSEENIVYVKKDDPRIDVSLKIIQKGKVVAILADGLIKSVDSDDPRFSSGEIKNFHTGKKRSDETKIRMKESRKNYVFTEEHIANLKISQRKMVETYHIGAKRNDEWKYNISKSRFGSKSKVAKIWEFKGPNGEYLVYKGGRGNACALFNLSGQRIKNNIGKGVIPYPTNPGHLNVSVYNCTGWCIEQIEDEGLINFEFYM